jgi:hypothetical protein
MDISKLDLHDANLLGIALDPVSRTAKVMLAYYEGEASSARVSGTLYFHGVSRFNQLVDLEGLEAHAFAGNVTQWVSGERQGTSHLYLARGLIEVVSDSIELVRDPLP